MTVWTLITWDPSPVVCHSGCFSRRMKWAFARPGTGREYRPEEPGKCTGLTGSWGFLEPKSECLDSSVTCVLTLDLNTVYVWGSAPSAEISSILEVSVPKTCLGPVSSLENLVRKGSFRCPGLSALTPWSCQAEQTQSVSADL